MAKVKSTSVPCKTCGVDAGQPCQNIASGLVHGGRVRDAILEGLRRARERDNVQD